MTQLDVAALIKFLFVGGGTAAACWWPRQQRKEMERLRRAADLESESSRRGK